MIALLSTWMVLWSFNPSYQLITDNAPSCQWLTMIEANGIEPSDTYEVDMHELDCIEE